MNNIFFQDIFDHLQNILPDNWKQVVFFAGYTKGSYTMKYYVKTDQYDYRDCFEMDNVNNLQILQLFVSIDKLISRERATKNDTERWTVFSMSVDFSGKMKTDFDYRDISENSIRYENEWKQKYLV